MILQSFDEHDAYFRILDEVLVPVEVQDKNKVLIVGTIKMLDGGEYFAVYEENGFKFFHCPAGRWRADDPSVKVRYWRLLGAERFDLIVNRVKQFTWRDFAVSNIAPGLSDPTWGELDNWARYFFENVKKVWKENAKS